MALFGAVLDLAPFTTNTDSISLDSPIEAHLAWVCERIFLKPYKKQAPINDLCRPFHGAQHAGRVAVYVPILLNLLRKYGDVEALALSNYWVKLLQIAAIFHDSGREADGTDTEEWEVQSAVNLLYYLSLILKIPQTEACLLTEALYNKDYSPTKASSSYYELHCTISHSGITAFKFWAATQLKPKHLFSKILGMADCLDIMRARPVFLSRHLDFYTQYIQQDNNQKAIDDLAAIRTEIRSLIHSQGDLYGKSVPKIKIKYEHNPKELYRAIANDICKACIPQTNNLLRPALAALYNDGQLIQQNLLETVVISLPPWECKNFVEQSLVEGTLFARGIRTPAAILKKTIDKIAKLSPQDQRLNETNAHYELRKLLRTKDSPTASGQTGKSGILKRSTVLLGYGTNTYAASGLLFHTPNYNTTRNVSFVNSNSGWGKNKTLIEKPPESLREELQQLKRSIKMGGAGIKIQQYAATHNEVIMDLDKDMVLGIYYTQDSNLLNTRFSSNNGYPPHPATAVLEAVYLQKEYEQITGTHLPIYEYSSNHNFILKRPITEKEIISLWASLFADRCAEIIQQIPFELIGNDCVFTEKSLIHRIKIESSYPINPFNDYLQPLDANYEKPLAEKLEQAIAAVYHEYRLFIAVSLHHGNWVRQILLGIYQLPEWEHSRFFQKTNSEGRTALSYIRHQNMLSALQKRITPTPDDLANLQDRIILSIGIEDLYNISGIINLGCSINIRDSQGDTPLILAVKKDWLNGVDYFLRRGADPSITGQDGLTALSWAAKKGHFLIIQRLLKEPLEKVTAVNNDGSSAILHSNHLYFLELFQDKIAITPKDQEWLNKQLFIQYEHGHYNNVIRLIEFGADLGSKNKEGKSFETLVREEDKLLLVEKINTHKKLLPLNASKKGILQTLYHFFVLPEQELQDPQKQIQNWFGF